MKRPKWMGLLFFMALLTAGAEAMEPIVWQQFIDGWVTEAVADHQAGRPIDLQGLWEYGGLFLALFLVLMLAVGGFIVATGRVQEWVIYDLRNLMFARLQYLSYGFYDRNSIGHLSIRLTSDVRKVANVVAWGLLDLLFGTFMLLVSMIFMFAYNWKLSIVVLLTIPLLLFLAIKVRGLVIGYSRKARRLYSEMAAFLTEHINGVEVNKTTVQEERVSGEFDDVTERFRYSSTRSALYASMYGPIVVATGSLAAALVIYLGGHLALAETAGITVGVLAAFFGYARRIFEPIYNITSYVTSAQDSLSAGERIFSLIDEPLRITDREGVEEAFPPLRGEIQFQ
ncbi:MAG: ABC transporter transmembrane domain-containing protein, partial [Bacteroidota bacterium]